MESICALFGHTRRRAAKSARSLLPIRALSPGHKFLKLELASLSVNVGAHNADSRPPSGPAAGFRQNIQCRLLLCSGEYCASDALQTRSRHVPHQLTLSVPSSQVYECMVRGIAVMRRRNDSYVNATQILKVAGVDKGRRTKILEKEILPGKHEIVQGGYGKYQGTW